MGTVRRKDHKRSLTKMIKETLMISLLATSIPRGGDSFKLGRCEHDEMVDSVVKTLDCEMGIVKNVLNRGLLTKLQLKEEIIPSLLKWSEAIAPSMYLAAPAHLLKCAVPVAECLPPAFWEDPLNILKADNCNDNDESYSKGFADLQECAKDILPMQTKIQAFLENNTIPTLSTEECTKLGETVKCVVGLELSCFSEKENAFTQTVLRSIKDDLYEIFQIISPDVSKVLANAEITDITQNQFSKDQISELVKFIGKAVNCALG